MNQNLVKSKDPERQKIQQQVEEFLAKGNKITTVDNNIETRPSKRVRTTEALFM